MIAIVTCYVDEDNVLCLARTLAIFLFVAFLEDKTPVIRDEKGRERQGDDESDDAQQTAPNGETQQDDGWLQTRYMTHDFRGEIDVLNGLHDCKDG